MTTTCEYMAISRAVWAEVMAALHPAADVEQRWDAWETLLVAAPPRWDAELDSGAGAADRDADARLSDLCWAAAFEMPTRQLIEQSADLEVTWWAAGFDLHGDVGGDLDG